MLTSVFEYIIHFGSKTKFLKAVLLLIFLMFVWQANAQLEIADTVDSCKVFAANYSATYRVRVYPEYLMYDFNDTCFILDKKKQSRVLDTLYAFRNNARESKLEVKKLNNYSIDYRLLFLIYRGNNFSSIGFGANGLMAFDDKVYRYKKEMLYSLTAIIPALESALHLKARILK